MNYYYRDGEADLVYFVHEGHGTLETNFGLLPYHEGDYIIIPRGTTFRFQIAADSPASRFLTVEAYGTIEPPRRYLNKNGQLLEHSPYCERDIRRPQELVTHTGRGDYEVRVKVGNLISSYWYDFHPINTVGWDGCEYPWIFNIADFEPITGRVHQPPPVHQTFQGPNFVICSFVPRKLDYHPLSIPVPYNHSNIDSDETALLRQRQFRQPPWHRAVLPDAPPTWHPTRPASGRSRKEPGRRTHRRTGRNDRHLLPVEVHYDSADH